MLDESNIECNFNAISLFNCTLTIIDDRFIMNTFLFLLLVTVFKLGNNTALVWFFPIRLDINGSRPMFLCRLFELLNWFQIHRKIVRLSRLFNFFLFLRTYGNFVIKRLIQTRVRFMRALNAGRLFNS